jgi:hypothetical protein
MIRLPRTWDDVFDVFVIVVIGLLCGCSIALWLLAGLR